MATFYGDRRSGDDPRVHDRRDRHECRGRAEQDTEIGRQPNAVAPPAIIRSRNASTA
jgi:hypothetical protein